MVAVISNGTAVLGLGDIGALAAKPVMEGKGVLFGPRSSEVGQRAQHLLIHARVSFG